MSKVCDKYNQYLRMEDLKLPVFLNTEEKYNELVQKTDTVKKYEEVFYKLLEDDTLSLMDVLTLMKCFERDVILVHGMKGVSYVLDLTESIIRYMIQMTEEESKSNTKQKIKKEKPDSDSEGGEGHMVCDCNGVWSQTLDRTICLFDYNT